MSEPLRTVVITGASRGLGLASAKHLYDHGWHVLAAMRKVDVGMANLRRVTGASENDPRLTAITLDLDDRDSIASAARDILAESGAPDFVVHNAGVAAVGCAEDMTAEAVQQVFSTNFFGPVLLTNELLPAMRARRRGRVVVVSSLGGLRGLPATSTYSAAKAALERWAESLAYEIAPFGLGVSIVVAGSHRTEILTDGPIDCTNLEGPYSEHYQGMLGVQARFIDKAAAPEKFAERLAEALKSKRPFSRHVAGSDARGLILLSRLPESLVQEVVRRLTSIPAPVRSRRTWSRRCRRHPLSPGVRRSP